MSPRGLRSAETIWRGSSISAPTDPGRGPGPFGESGWHARRERRQPKL